MLELSTLRDAARSEGRVNRRLFLAYGAALSSLPWWGRLAAGQVAASPRFERDPFSLGVASGDPDDSSVVLWTRLAPRPLEGGGLPPETYPVRWEVAAEESFQTILQHGDTFATPQLGHSVHVELKGLEPDRWYWYRFHCGDAVSPIGRTRTTPAANVVPPKLRFAFASCQHYETGLYTAYEQMAQDELDLVFHLGDYIYEGPGRDGHVRKHVGGKLRTLEDYRNRYAQYRSDVNLARMHARCPWVVTWDDHEVENNYAGGISAITETDPVAFLDHRANAYQAYYEMMPLRPRSLPRGPHMKLYRTLHFGRLATFQVLDTRQYRTDQPNNDKASALNDEALHPHNTMLGAEQADWLKNSLLQSTATWNVLAQQVMMGMVYRKVDDEPRYSMDQWPGYAAERIRLMKFVAERQVPNTVVLTGDIHSNWVNNLHVDDRQAETPVVATEFVGTSISSGGNGAKEIANLETLLSENPGVLFHNRQRGYVRLHR
ncbi:MAG: alkaline phosphatase D family protein [Planctomycetaceae bacterium]